MADELLYGKMIDMFQLALEMQQNPEGLSLKDIEQWMNCGRRTAERIRDALMRLFPSMNEIETGERTKRWHIYERPLSPLISFSAEELTVLDTAAASLETQGMNDKAELLRSVSLKLRNQINPREKRKLDPDIEAMMNAEGIACRPGPRIRIDAGILRDLRFAVLAPRQIEIVYDMRGKDVPFVLKPYAFLYGERNHYLIAKNKKGAFRSFILTKIRKLTVSDKTFERDPKFDLKKYAAKSFGAYQEDPFDVEWLFSPESAEAAKLFLFHPTQRTTENPDGSLTVKFKAGGILEMAWHIRTWGENVTVVKPADFWERAEKAQKAFEKGL